MASGQPKKQMEQDAQFNLMTRIKDGERSRTDVGHNLTGSESTRDWYGEKQLFAATWSSAGPVLNPVMIFDRQAVAQRFVPVLLSSKTGGCEDHQACGADAGRCGGGGGDGRCGRP